MYTADNICKMIEFLIDNIFVQFGGRLFRQAIGIPIGTNCAPLLADLFLYSYENEYLDNMIKSGHRRLARSFNLCYRYIDDLIVFNNKKFLDYLKEIYPSQLTVEKANKSDHLADYLDLTFIIDSGGKLSTRLYDKLDDFDFHIVNFPYLSSNIPSGPSFGVYISQLIRCARWYQDKPPGQNPPDINPRTKPPWTKTPLAKNPPDKNPPEKTYKKQNIFYINNFLPWSCFILLDQLIYD